MLPFKSLKSGLRINVTVKSNCTRSSPLLMLPFKSLKSGHRIIVTVKVIVPLRVHVNALVQVTEVRPLN